MLDPKRIGYLVQKGSYITTECPDFSYLEAPVVFSCPAESCLNLVRYAEAALLSHARKRTLQVSPRVLD